MIDHYELFSIKTPRFFFQQNKNTRAPVSEIVDKYLDRQFNTLQVYKLVN